MSCLLKLPAEIVHPHRESDGKVIITQHWTVSQNWALPHLLELVFQPQDDSLNVSGESLLLSHLAVVFQPHPVLRPLSEFPSSQVFVTLSCSTRIHFHSLKWLCGDYSCCRLLWNLSVMFLSELSHVIVRLLEILDSKGCGAAWPQSFKIILENRVRTVKYLLEARGLSITEKATIR